MAKKAVGKVRSTEKKAMVKVIIPQKSPKTGAYAWQSTMLPLDKAEKLLQKGT